MNAAVTNYDTVDFDYRTEFGSSSGRRKSTPSRSTSNRPSFGRKRGKHPQQFNGIHRRRKKKISW